MIVTRVWTHISTMRYNLLPPLQTFTSLIRFPFDHRKTWPTISFKGNIVSCFIIAPCVELLLWVVKVDGLGVKRIVTVMSILSLFPLSKQVLYLLVSWKAFIIATQVNIMVVIIGIVWNIPSVHSHILSISLFLSFLILFVFFFHIFCCQKCYIAH